MSIPNSDMHGCIICESKESYNLSEMIKIIRSKSEAVCSTCEKIARDEYFAELGRKIEGEEEEEESGEIGRSLNF